MTRKKKPTIPPRPGKPSNCVCCGKALHRKSEYYCSPGCGDVYCKRVGETAPPFLSKWKIRKRKELEDPLIALRRKVRKRTKDLIKRGVLRRGVCVVCGQRDVVPHHEDYTNPSRIIWLCDGHHKEYHDGEIALFGGKLRWDPQRLTKVRGKAQFPEKKYRTLSKTHSRKVAGKRSSKKPEDASPKTTEKEIE